MDTLTMWIAVLRIILTRKVMPYVARYGYGQRHSAGVVRRSLRYQVGNVQVVKAARTIGYAARMSHMGAHTGEVYA